jgi:hypothetical protein
MKKCCESEIDGQSSSSIDLHVFFFKVVGSRAEPLSFPHPRLQNISTDNSGMKDKMP